MTQTDARVAEVLKWLERRGTKRNRDGMARYGIVAQQVFGVSVADVRDLGKRLGRDHELALALWETGWYEARMLTAFVDEPDRVTSRQMDRWAKDFDNWAVCDGICFHLFDKTPLAWRKVEVWAPRREEFVKRAAFALLAALALHDKKSPDQPFVAALPLIDRAASDERNFVKKGVSWALRSIGSRNAPLHAAALELARRLAASESAPARWIGRDAVKDLSRPLISKRVAARSARQPRGSSITEPASGRTRRGTAPDIRGRRSARSSSS
jgi:3-methyladenine DNA glycosylase AlkD